VVETTSGNGPPPDASASRRAWPKLAAAILLAGVVCVLLSMVIDRIWDVEWTAVAAVGGVSAAIATSIAIMVYAHWTEKQLRQDRAHFAAERADREEEHRNREIAATRAAIDEFASVMKGVCRQVSDGSALMSTCWLTAQLMIDVSRRPSDGSPRDRLRSLVEGDDGSFELLWARAAETSPSMSALVTRADSLRSLAFPLRGELALTSSFADYVSFIVDDVRTVLPFTLGEPYAGPRIREKIVESCIRVDDGADPLSVLAGGLHRVLADSVIVRGHTSCATLIYQIVGKFQEVCRDLPSQELLAASRANIETLTPAALTERLFERAQEPSSLMKAAVEAFERMVSATESRLSTLEALRLLADRVEANEAKWRRQEQADQARRLEHDRRVREDPIGAFHDDLKANRTEKGSDEPSPTKE
jgi:hypothetical protein